MGPRSKREQPRHPLTTRFTYNPSVSNLHTTSETPTLRFTHTPKRTDDKKSKISNVVGVHLSTRTTPQFVFLITQFHVDRRSA